MNARLRFALLALLCASPLAAGDWPQILGPNRNGIAEGEKLAAAWPAGGPKALWQKSVGRGFAGVAVSGGKAVLFHRVDDQEIVECLDARSGRQQWKTSFPTKYAGGYVEDDGPRCTPLIAGDRVYLFGAAGALHAVAMADGKKLWSRDCAADFNAPDGYFGAGSTPILEAGKLLVNVGADRSHAGIVAFDPANGKTLWQATDEQASYSSPIAVTIDGVRQVIFVTRLSALSIDAENGQVRWKFPFGARGPTVNGANPVVIDNHLFLTASYSVGAVWARISKSEARVLWKNDDVMSSQYPTPVAVGGLLYGIDGRQDIGTARLRCIDPKDGKVHWTQEGFGMASGIFADGKLLLVKTAGEAVMIDPSPDGLKQLAKASLLSGTIRALPALSDGLLYVRDEAMLKCFDLSGGP
jgi:outer membrane protein assembly factor BamB